MDCVSTLVRQLERNAFLSINGVFYYFFFVPQRNIFLLDWNDLIPQFNIFNLNLMQAETRPDLKYVMNATISPELLAQACQECHQMRD